MVENYSIDIIDSSKMRDFSKICPNFDLIISCLGSRTGGIKDSWNVEFMANKNLLELGKSRAIGQFILLSAICLQRPRLEFQYAKIAFEKILINSGINYTIIRATSFFKSLSGQVKKVKNGKKFIYFDDGQRTSCKPISEKNLAEFICKCINSREKFKKVLPIGGPGPALTPIMMGTMLFEIINEKPRFRSIPSRIFKMADKSIAPLSFFSEKARNTRQFLKIAHYYASESMLFYNLKTESYDEKLTPEYGNDRLENHYQKLLSSELINDELGAHKLF